MKKIIYSLMCLGTLVLSSCSMDLAPTGSIVDSEAILSADDCFRFRNGFYNNLRSLSTGGYVTYTEIQMDQFVGTLINGNRLGNLNNGVILSSDSDIESIWGGLYGGIADANFFIDAATKLLDNSTDMLEGDKEDIQRYIAESRFARAFFYYFLLDHYCPAYNSSNGGQQVGLPLTLTYNPTADKSSYPDRGTLDATYDLIEADLQAAYDGLKAYEKIDKSACTPMSPYLSSWAVMALQARLALLKGDYASAQSLAQQVIDSKVYTLATRADYAKMWTDDTNNEIIFRPLSTQSELGISSTGGAWLGVSDYSADYVPVAYVAEAGEHNLYTSRDIRYNTFIGSRQLAMEGALYRCPTFTKFPGNPALMVGGSVNLLNMPKVFRLSEMYLIVAEAACEQGDEETANKVLETIRANRISRYTYTATSGNALRNEVRLERNRELIGEGFRMSDLRRWGLGFDRSTEAYPTFPACSMVLTDAGQEVTYQPGDHRYVWPIPSSEIQVNPKLQGFQNPGY